MNRMSKSTREAIRQVNGLSRRDFLKAASGLAVAASVGTSLLGASQAFASLPEGINVMSRSEYAIMARLMDVTLPTAGTSLIPTSQIPVMQTLDAALLATMEPHILEGLKGGIQYFNEGPKASFGKTFVELSDSEAKRFCDAWGDSDEVPHRALAVGLKKLIGLSYWANPPTWAPLGYDGPVTNRWGIKSLGNAPMPKQ